MLIGWIRWRVLAVAVLSVAMATLPAVAGPSVPRPEEGTPSTIGSFVRGVIDGWMEFFSDFLGPSISAHASSTGSLQPLTGPTAHENDGGPVGGVQSPEDRTVHENDGGPIG